MSERHFSNPFIETVRERSDLVSVVSHYLTLKKAGRNYTGLCPFHTEKTPSFSVNPAKQFFYCFGCGAGGDVFRFMMKIEGLLFPEAVEKIAEDSGIPLPSFNLIPKKEENEAAQIYRLNEETAAFYHSNLLKKPEGEKAMAYLKQRGVTDETIRTFGLGFATNRWDGLLTSLHKKYSLPFMERAGVISKSSEREEYYDRFRNRIMFPIRDRKEKVVGFGGRVLEDTSPKYLNTAETPVFKKGGNLFGIDRVRGRGPLVVVEGYLDMIMAHQADIPNVVATLGTALTEDHLRLMQKNADQVILIFDPDEAGRRAALRAVPMFIEKEMAVRVVTLPQGEDPDLFIRRHGGDCLRERLKEGKSLIDFSILSLTQGIQSIEDRKRVISEVFLLLAPLKDKVERGDYLKKLSEELEVSEADIRSQFLDWTKNRKKTLPKEEKGGSVKQRLAAPIPAEEEMLIAMLLQNQMELSWFSDRLNLYDFTHPDIQRVVAYFLDESKGPWRRPESESAVCEDPLFPRLSVMEISQDSTQKIAEDCARVLCAKRLEREGSHLKKELIRAEEGGDLVQVRSLQQRFFELRKELNRLVASR